MIEGFFLLSVLFIAYVVYVVVNEKKACDEKAAAAAASEPSSRQAPVEQAPSAAEVATETKATEEPVAQEKTVPAEPAKVPSASKGLKDPKTGDVAATFTNYRFTKRWIKEALVAEGLVEKIYKNDELTAEVEAKIRAGVEALESMDKYRA
jgi:hypothetical protein